MFDSKWRDTDDSILPGDGHMSCYYDPDADGCVTFEPCAREQKLFADKDDIEFSPLVDIRPENMAAY